jgi:predicted dehydrogenase
MDTLAYGIIGCGEHALMHAKAAKSLQSMDLVAISDVSQEALARFEKSYGTELKKCTRKELYSAADAVFISTPDEHHLADLEEALANDVHVLVEKPIITSSGEISRMLDCLEHALAKGLRISSCHPRRFDPPYQWLKQQIPALGEKLGSVASFAFDFSYHAPGAFKHKSLLLDHANHEIDLLHYLFGHCSFDAHALKDGPYEYSIAGQRDDGITFTFSGTRGLDARVYRDFAFVRFQKGTLSLDASTGTARVADHETGEETELVAPKTSYLIRNGGVMENFARSILYSEESYLLPEDLKVNNMVSLLAAGESMRYER